MESNMRQQSTAARVFNINDVQADVEQAMVPFAPPRRLPPMTPLPDYVEHRADVTEVGRLTAAAVVQSYEAAAKEVEALGAELQARLDKLEETKADAAAALAEIKETAAAYRDEGKRVFLQIEDCALMTAEVRATCGALKSKIVGPSS